MDLLNNENSEIYQKTLEKQIKYMLSKGHALNC